MPLPLPLRRPTLKILLIEDNATIASQICTFFEGVGWVVDYANSGSQGLALIENTVYDVLVLDLGLPDIDGLEVCASVKSECHYSLPVLMLTARDAFEDKAQGFGKGADDYVTKPFDFRELKLRCEALAKRHGLHREHQLVLGELSISVRNGSAQRCNEPLQLTGIGFRILLELARAYPDPVSRTVLIHKLWGDDPPDSDALRSHIYSLRNALDKPFKTPMLKTITNIGYQLVGEEGQN